MARAFLADCGGVMTRSSVREYLADNAGNAPATQALRIGVLKAFSKWAVSEAALAVITSCKFWAAPDDHVADRCQPTALCMISAGAACQLATSKIRCHVIAARTAKGLDGAYGVAGGCQGEAIGVEDYFPGHMTQTGICAPIGRVMESTTARQYRHVGEP